MEYEDGEFNEGNNNVSRVYNPDRLMDQSIVEDVRGKEFEPIAGTMWKAYHRGLEFLISNK